MTVAMMFDGGWLHERPAARAIWQTIMPHEDRMGRCLLTGDEAPLADLHPRVTVGRSMAALVSYEEKALDHYGHKGGDNSPISEAAAHGYTAALDHLIARGHRVTVGDTVAAYWSEIKEASAAATAEQLLAAILEGTAGPDAKAEAAKLRDALGQLARGKPVSGVMPEASYCILAIEPGTGRHAIRSFLHGTMGELARNVSAHQEAMRLAPADGTPSVREIAAAAVRTGDDPSPSLSNDLLRSILTGSPYPAALVQGVLARLRAGDEINNLRAGILKAFHARNKREITTVNCNPDNPSTAYQLGRLLAAVEAVQRAAMPDVGVTARERYYRMLSMRPAVAMAGMMGGLTHHLATLRRAGKGGLAALLDREVQEVANRIGEVPAAMTVAEQSLLAVGYYQQKTASDEARAARRAARQAAEDDVSVAP